MFHAIVRQHGKQFNDEQKKELHNQIDGTVQSLEKLRAYTLENWDEPAAVLHLPVTNAAPLAKSKAPASASAKGGR